MKTEKRQVEKEKGVIKKGDGEEDREGERMCGQTTHKDKQKEVRRRGEGQKKKKARHTNRILDQL